MRGLALRSLLIVAALAVMPAGCRRAEEPREEALSLPAGSPDEDSDDKLTLVPPGYERAAAGLSYLFHVSGDVFGTVDPIDGDVVFLSEAGRQLGAARLPDGFQVRDIDVGSSIVLLGDKAAVVIPRSGAIPALLRSVRKPAPSTIVIRKGRALEQSYRKDGRRIILTVEPRGPGEVFTVTFLGFDQAGRPYAYWEEGTGRSVDAWVGRFGSDGKLAAGARLDLSQFEDIPAVPVAVTPAGTVLLMQPNEESIDMIELTLLDGRIGEAVQKRLGEAPVEVMDVGDQIAAPANLPYPPARGAPPPYNPAFGAVTLARARQFLVAQWTLKPGNYLQSGIVHECEPERGRTWSRPARFTRDKVGTNVTGLPYKWGGFDSVEQFKQRVNAARPALAGNVCTCREPRYGGCMVARAAGVDCSGFISRAWGLKIHTGTSLLAQEAVQLPGFLELKPGDILNRPGNHVRLFVRFEPGPEVRLRTLESAVSCGGVCEKIYTPAQLIYYRPMRLKRS
jgi:hypothetical protein